MSMFRVYSEKKNKYDVMMNKKRAPIDGLRFAQDGLSVKYNDYIILLYNVLLTRTIICELRETNKLPD